MNRALLRAGAALLAALLAGGSLALIAEPARAESEGFAIGDSVMLGASWALRKRGLEVDAEKSRQAGAAPGVIRRQGPGLSQAVVVHLGTNGVFPEEICDRLVERIGQERTLFLVTVKVPRSWERSNNRVIHACATRHNNVRIIDWNAAATENPGWLYDDGVHLRPSGARAFARMIAEAVSEVNAPATSRRS